MSTQPRRPLRELTHVRALYEVPRDDIATELLIPAMTVADRVRVMAGFFSSESFAVIAPGLAAFLNSSGEPLQMLISPHLSPSDRDAVDRALRDPEVVGAEAAARLFEGAVISEFAIVRHVVDCLAYLVARGRLSMRFVLMTRGMFHPKVWLFDSGDDVLAVHGSSNATEAGLLYNAESVSVDRPWLDGDAASARAAAFGAMFSEYWHNKRPDAIAVDLPAGLAFARTGAPGRVPTVADFWAAWAEDHKNGLAAPLPADIPRPLWLGPAGTPSGLELPAELNVDTGPYCHQGEAVRAWENNNRRGILAIATGGGKTITAFVAATRLQNEATEPLLLVVLAPTTPLVDQWASETRRFGLTPYVLNRLGAGNRIAELHGIVTGLRHGVARTEVLICSNALFGDEALRAFLAGLPAEIRVMLVADEVHNLGTPRFLTTLPDTIEYRLGLSATPVRQYDTAGSEALEGFFGPVVFEFSLAAAIRAGCLTPYRYHLHPVELSPAEMLEWEQLTERLSRLQFATDDVGQVGGLDDRVQRLLERRRAVLEHAEAKIETLEGLLRAEGPRRLSRTLIYTSAKSDPLGRGRQITRINHLLAELGVISHQLTYAETGGAERAREILRRFAEGDYKVLTAMKVLDEGLDVPATRTAFLVASSTVRREWVQRRGRVLRRAAGKTHADLHDFLVVPPDAQSRGGRAILRAELDRADEFCGLAENEWDSDGPRTITQKYE